MFALNSKQQILLYVKDTLKLVIQCFFIARFRFSGLLDDFGDDLRLLTYLFFMLFILYMNVGILSRFSLQVSS